jgi:two-component system, cell cycle sensor histidine kinase and response regulator CckA
MKTLAALAATIGKRVTQLRRLDSRRPHRILIVDDDDLTRQYLRDVLSEAGYAPTVAVDGPDALFKWQDAGPFDVLVTDLMMPMMTGDELARRVRRMDPTMPVLYVTGYSEELFGGKHTLWEDEAFLEKPCSPASVVEAVAVLLKGHVPQKTVWA